MFQSNVSIQLWCYAIKYVVHLIDCTPILFLENSLPFEKFYDKTCDVFGCLCYFNPITTNGKKLDTPVAPESFLGFKLHTKS